ncbi:ABC transporter ATP-binding protein [Solicola sp. PLA-1-18]|uniref:ABC transporter ATP-binding protein n=1 Tax=Solicola sp. PLA-1-18 TaxID=3380532 RepID=UPI003B75DF9E
MGRTTSDAPAVSLAGITKTFGDVTAVDGLDLTMRAGEVVALLGPNGAGKTTTIDMILGLAEPTQGVVRVYGAAPREAVGLGRVSAVMQTGGLLKDFTVAETVRFAASLYRPARPVDEVLERAGITAIAGRKVQGCSGGEQQRLRFALALLPDPDLLVLDEPTTGMDVSGRRDFWGAMREDAGRGRTVLFATHYLEEADAYADRIVLVRHGRVVADGSAAEIKAMAAGRTLRATLPGADADRLGTLPGVDSVEIRGDSVLLHARDTDEAARWLLTQTTAHDLEITSNNLEDAFVALTSDHEGALA